MGQISRHLFLVGVVICFSHGPGHVLHAESLPAGSPGDSLLIHAASSALSHQQVPAPEGAPWYTRGFYNSDELLGIGMRLMDDQQTYEFTWERIPLRRLSLGVFAEMNVDNRQQEKLGALGGGVSGQFFLLLPGKHLPIGAYLGTRLGGNQCFDEDWGRQGGILRGHGEAGAYLQLGREIMLIPRVALRRTEFKLMRHGEQIASANEEGFYAGIEARIKTLVPGFFVYTSDGVTTYEVSLRFAYKG